MALTYEPIATTTLGGAAANITFSSITSAYTDLRLVLVGTETSGGGYPVLRYNSDTGSNYSTTALTGNGTAAGSNRFTSQTVLYLDYINSFNTTTPIMVTVDIFSYSSSTLFKTNLSTWSGDINGSGAVERTVGLWQNTAAINTIQILPFGGTTFKANTTATLYGIKRA